MLQLNHCDLKGNNYLCIMDGKVTYWIEMSDYDLETADAMLLTGRYLYVGSCATKR